MISFKLDRSQQALMAEFRFVATELLRPFAAEADKIADLPAGLLRKPEMAMLMRGFVPVEFGGGWQGLLDPARRYNLVRQARLRVIACEECGAGDPALTISLPGPGLAYPAFRAQGTPEQQQRFFNSFLGETLKWSAFAVTEPKTGSDVPALMTMVRKEKDCYVINGTKWLIGNGARADWVVVLATINPAQGQFGIRSLFVERGTPGFRVGQILPSLGLNAVQLTELIFEDCRVDQENLLGQQRRELKGRGFQAGTQTFNLVRPGIAAMAVGLGRSALEDLEEVMVQNGARHIAARQWRAVSDSVQSLKSKLDAARLLCWKAATLADHEKDNSREVSMAKAMSAKVAMDICSESMDVACRSGVDDLGTFERRFRNAKAFDILEGTGDIQKTMIARSLVRG